MEQMVSHEESFGRDKNRSQILSYTIVYTQKHQPLGEPSAGIIIGVAATTISVNFESTDLDWCAGAGNSTPVGYTPKYPCSLLQPQ